VTNRLILAEYVADFQELESGTGVEIITRWDDGTTVLRTNDAAGNGLGSVELALSRLGDSHAYGDRVVIVGTGWEERSFYQIAVVDCTVPTAPVIETALRINVDPYWGGGCYDCYYGYPEVDAAFENKSFAPWFPSRSPSNISFISGNLLTLRCGAADYDVVLGNNTPNEGIVVVDLAAGEWVQTIGLGYEHIVSLDDAGGKLYLGTRKSAGTNSDGQPLVAHYIAELDPALASIGPAVNVPGSFVQYDPDTEALVVENIQYSEESNPETGSGTGVGQTDAGPPVDAYYDIWYGYVGMSRSLTSLLWDGGEEITEGNSIDLPAYPQYVLGRGGNIFVDYYEEGYNVLNVSVSGAGVLALGGTAALGDAYAYLLHAQEDTAYLSVGGRAVAVYDFSGAPELSRVVEVMEPPLRLRFGAETAYVPLGYAGLARIAP
jgi:hypothetical protein